MLLSKDATVVWNARNKSYYTQRGYEFTKMKDKFSVRVEDLTDGSQAFVRVRCDYCGFEYDVQWYTYKYTHNKSDIHTDACSHCGNKKALDVVAHKYGSYSEMFNASNDKRVKTNILKYGCANVFGGEIVKQKIVETNMEKYGVPYTQQSDAVRRKTIQSCLERYGVENYVELFRGKFIKENSPVWKGGVPHSRVERATYEYNTWRKSVFSKDNYTCAACGARNGTGKEVELHAHHIRCWVDNEDLRYDVNNGITLCSSCHYRFHSKYGKHNTTEQQSLHFLDEQIELDNKIC